MVTSNTSDIFNSHGDNVLGLFKAPETDSIICRQTHVHIPGPYQGHLSFLRKNFATPDPQ